MLPSWHSPHDVLKILLSSHAFAPSVGGIETVSGLLAAEFCALGHTMKVVTQTPADGGEEGSFAIARNPSTAQLFELVKWCDVFWQNNLSLRTVWPGLFLRKPVIVTHAGSYCVQPSGLDLKLRLKHALVKRVRSVAISQYIASCFKTESVIIPNPYDARIFHASASAARSGDLIFLGRLVSEKGLDLLFEALTQMAAGGIRPGLTVVGTGPELEKLQRLAMEQHLDQQVRFVGSKRGTELVEILNQHKILVVPSRYDEPFGVVALEGIACGCVVVGSNGGGLPEAIGPCGVTFPNGDAVALAAALQALLQKAHERERLSQPAAQHLAQFHPRAIANRYLELFQSEIK